PGPTSQLQPPPPVARPHTPFELPPPAPPAPVPVAPLPVPVLALVEVEVPLPALALVLLVSTTQLPARHAWPIGHTTPSQGSLPHEPVTGSHDAPCVHGIPVHLSSPQVGGTWVVSQTLPAAQAGLHVGLHSPSTHAS